MNISSNIFVGSVLLFLAHTVMAVELPVETASPSLAEAGVQSDSSNLAAVPVMRVELPRLFRLDGVVEAINQTTVSAQTSGQVEQVLVDVEDFVNQGDLLVVLNDTEQRARVEQSEARLKAAEARLLEARQEHRRISEVYEKKVIAKSELDKAAAALKSASAERDAAIAALAQAREQLDYTRIRAPYTGIVIERHLQVGEMAQPGVALMSGVSLEQLRVQVDVPQSLIGAVREFGKGRVFTSDGHSVEVDRITVFPYADQGANSFRVRLELPEGLPNLFPGMYVKVAFVTGIEQTLLIPDEALVQRSEVKGVYVLGDDGRIHFRHIRTGRRSKSGLAVLSGLSDGEMVLLDPVAAAAELKAQRANVDPQVASGE